jgi:hypothetical protein
MFLVHWSPRHGASTLVMADNAIAHELSAEATGYCVQRRQSVA